MLRHHLAKIQRFDVNLMENHWLSVVFIDVDNTIIKGPFESVVFPIIFSEISGKSGLGVDEIRRLVVKENLDRQQDPKIPAVVAMDWDDIVRTVAATLGVRVTPSVVDIVRSHTYPPYSSILDDAQNVLRLISRPHRAIVAATKGLRKYQLPILDALGLTSLFTDILTPDTSNALKTEVSFYGKWPSLTKLQISVGDYYEDDVRAPKAFGFKTIWIPNRQNQNNELRSMHPLTRPLVYSQESQSVQPDAIITSLQELEEAIAQIEARHL